MKIIWHIEAEDIRKVKTFYDDNKNNSFVLERIERNIRKSIPQFSKDIFWETMVSCLLTTQQRSSPNSPITIFICTEPFPLSYPICKKEAELQKFVEMTLENFGGIRRTKIIGDEIQQNLTWLEEGGWNTINSIVNELIENQTVEIDRDSLDPPDQGEKFRSPERRTTEYLAKFTEAENYTFNRPNPHWAMTQIIEKDILRYFGYPTKRGAAVVEESYSGRMIENVTQFFAHVNVAKCCVRHPNKRQAAREVHETCSEEHLVEELNILQPDILITQGKTTNEILGMILIGRQILGRDLPFTRNLKMPEKPLLWMPMRHPTQQIAKIRQEWPFYKRRIEETALKKKRTT